MPVHNLINDNEYAYLAGYEGYIFSILKRSFEIFLENNEDKQETIELVAQKEVISGFELKNREFEEVIESVQKIFEDGTCILCDYYVVRDTMYIHINIWDIKTLQIKNCFIERMASADNVDLILNIKEMFEHIVTSVVMDLPPTEREAFLNRNIITYLREKIDREEKLMQHLFSLSHEIQCSLFTGLNLGRTVVSWSEYGPFISPALNIEYTYFFRENYHIRAGFEYLPFDFIDMGKKRYEISLEILAGLHTRSLFSLALDGGCAFIYDYNQSSQALSYSDGSETQYPKIERFSISLPLQIGFSIYIGHSFFINLRFKYHGLTYTFEPLSQQDYNIGSESLKYISGFSPWNLLCISIIAHAGFRF